MAVEGDTAHQIGYPCVNYKFTECYAKGLGA